MDELFSFYIGASLIPATLLSGSLYAFSRAMAKLGRKFRWKFWLGALILWVTVALLATLIGRPILGLAYATAILFVLVSLALVIAAAVRGSRSTGEP